MQSKFVRYAYVNNCYGLISSKVATPLKEFFLQSKNVDSKYIYTYTRCYYFPCGPIPARRSLPKVYLPRALAAYQVISCMATVEVRWC